MCSCKNLTDSVVRATADTLQGPIQSAYREAFQSVVLPAFEKSCQSMFQQINDTFKQGTQECESSLGFLCAALVLVADKLALG